MLRQRQAPRSRGTDQDLGRLIGSPLERDVGERQMAAGARDLLAREQRADRRGDLRERGHPPLRQRSTLRHPLPHPVPERSPEASRMQARERCDLHRGERRVAQRRGHQAEPDTQTPGRGERGRRHHETAGEEAVLHQPELVEPELLGPAREGGQRFDLRARRKHDAEGRSRSRGVRGTHASLTGLTPSPLTANR